tara:strand:+ start:861 stop:1022 length:162 start_codon:yes stop_codon:yes gene_type:complete
MWMIVKIVAITFDVDVWPSLDMPVKTSVNVLDHTAIKNHTVNAGGQPFDRGMS